MPLSYTRAQINRRWEHFLRHERPVYARYLGALAIGCCGMLLEALASNLTGGPHYPFTLLATVIATFYGGLGPGLLVSILDGLVEDYFYVEPTRSFLSNWYSFALFFIPLLLSVATSLIVSTLRSAFRQLDETRRSAERGARAREDILAVVSHDLRNPVSSILLGCGLLRKMARDLTPESLESRIIVIEQSARQMNRLIQDLLDASNIDAGRLAVRLESESVESLLAHAVEAFELQARIHGISLKLEAEPGLPDVLCDRDRVQQLFSNLVGNAIRFTPRDGVITVRARASDGFVQFEVRDTGPGIGEAHLQRIFERQWQARESSLHGGAGLGLYIARGIVLSHGGTIRVESSVGEGATFLFTLPAKLRKQARSTSERAS